MRGTVRGFTARRWVMCEAQQTARCMLGAVIRFEPVKHAVLFPYSLWCCCFTQILFLGRTHRELYCELGNSTQFELPEKFMKVSYNDSLSDKSM